MGKMRMESVDMTAQNVDKIAALFPNCITEAKGKDGKLKRVVNFDMLRQMLSGEVSEGDEAYEFTWVGKKAAIVEANKSTRKTLRPIPNESIEWDSTENLYIEGDNLDVLKLLQESYLNRIKLIYIDPPYNTGSDFIYCDDFTITSDDYDEQLGVVGDEGIRLFKNVNTNGRFHSDWCSMIYPRLLLARNLLSEDGVIFISIDDNEVENLISICNEVFGKQNYVGTVIWERAFSPKNDAKYFSSSHDYVVVYAKTISCFKIGKLPRTAEMNARYKNPDNDPKGPWQSGDLTAKTYSAAYDYPIETPSGKIVRPTSGRSWITSKDNMKKWIDEGRIWFGENGDNTPRFKRYLADMTDGIVPTTLWKYEEVGHSQEGRQEVKKLFDGEGLFDGPKPVRLLQKILTVGNVGDNDIVLDFFSGSASTAHAVMKKNSEDNCHCKFIMIQLPEVCEQKSAAYKGGYKNICDIGKERIKRAGKAIKEESLSKGVSIDVGFRVFKLDDSNMNDVYYAAEDYTQNLLSMMESNVKSDRSDLDLLFGCLLEWGLPLSMPYTSEEVDGFTIHTYNDGDLIACFEENISDNVVKTIAKRQPLRAVFRDSSFNGSPAKINFGEIFKMIAPDTRVKVI